MNGIRTLAIRYGLVFCSLLLGSAPGAAQTSGNVGFGQSIAKDRAEQLERNLRTLTAQDLPPANSMFVDAAVLMNVKADEYVAVFAIAEEGTTVDEANARIDATVKDFRDALRALRIRDTDIYVDRGVA